MVIIGSLGEVSELMYVKLSAKPDTEVLLNC